MTKRPERGQRRQAENGAGPTLAHLVEPMLAGMSTTRQHLLAWVRRGMALRSGRRIAPVDVSEKGERADRRWSAR